MSHYWELIARELWEHTLKYKQCFIRCFSWSFITSNTPAQWYRVLHSDDREKSRYLIVIKVIQLCQMRCSISSPVVKQFKYKIFDICLTHVDLIHTHVSHLIYSWASVHLMNLYVIRIDYVQTSNNTPFI